MARILIVDDDVDIIEASRVMLEMAGHQVEAAYSYKEGLDAALKLKPDLMILDVMMDEPDDGFALAQALRGRGITTPIIMLTSVSRVTGMHFGVDDDLLPVNDFVQKPVDPAVLQEKVRALLA
ncbi:MAG: response regulator [bacterium]|jgi:DNA-binding response OmpR family regulator|nr:response regulator [bacterium]